MKEHEPENKLSVERRNRLSAINVNADAMGLNFKLNSEHLVANTIETDKLIEEAGNILKKFEEMRKESNRKLEDISSKIFSSK